MSTAAATADPVRPGQIEPHARVVELFSSIQGEAELIGVRQIFLRFFGCNIRCAWCDSPETLTAPKGAMPPARLEVIPASAEWRFAENPVDLTELLDAIDILNRTPHHSISLTGGEPLLHARFLSRLLPELQQRSLPAYLETNGLLPDHLARVIERIDYLAMDFKPPSCTGDPVANWLQLHRRFLQVWNEAGRNARLLLKIVVAGRADLEEMESCFRLAAELAPGASLTLQPVTPTAGFAGAPSYQEMLQWQSRAARYVREVRLLPQLHQLLKIL